MILTPMQNVKFFKKSTIFSLFLLADTMPDGEKILIIGFLHKIPVHATADFCHSKYDADLKNYVLVTVKKLQFLLKLHVKGIFTVSYDLLFKIFLQLFCTRNCSSFSLYYFIIFIPLGIFWSKFPKPVSRKCWMQWYIHYKKQLFIWN
jgi:hypothetical protein